MTARGRRRYLFSANVRGFRRSSPRRGIRGTPSLQSRRRGTISFRHQFGAFDGEPVRCRSTGSGPEQKPKGIAPSALGIILSESLGRCPRLG
jgi:hypothetical protein